MFAWLHSFAIETDYRFTGIDQKLAFKAYIGKCQVIVGLVESTYLQSSKACAGLSDVVGAALRLAVSHHWT